MNHIYDCSILVVDDNDELLQMVSALLRKEGFVHIETAGCCKEALGSVKSKAPDFIVLDVMLPDGDGFSLFQDIRAVSDAPVLFLSARDEDNDRLLGLGLGADDYLTKPFLPRELLLRINAILRRTYFSPAAAAHGADTLTLGGRTVHFDSGTVTFQDTCLNLTAKELLLLKKLSDNRGNIVTFDALCEAAWGDGYYSYENTLMVHIRRLREKIEEEPSRPRFLLTARGIGYRLAKGEPS